MAKACVILIALVACVYGHGRFMKPPSRSSVWRVPEFQGHVPPPKPNYDDNQLYCGGLHQADDPGSNCGVCGDPQSSPAPRDNEIGGTYDQGIITGNYRQGEVIEVQVDLTTSHQGHMEWRLCTNPQTENQDCFNRNVLQLEGGGTKFPAGATGLHSARVRLPSGVTCERCVIQWNYRAGNGWGDCGNGTSGSGCGPQETFRGCADVRIS